MRKMADDSVVSPANEPTGSSLHSRLPHDKTVGDKSAVSITTIRSGPLCELYTIVNTVLENISLKEPAIREAQCRR